MLPLQERAPEGDPGRRNAAVLGELSRRERVYLSSTGVRGAFTLRTCIINHRTTDADITAIVKEVLAAAAATPDRARNRAVRL